MDSYLIRFLFAISVWFLLFQVSILGFISQSQNSHVTCIARERRALLNFKQSLRDYYGILSTWRNDENNGDCCKWRGVECDNETGHVHMLQLQHLSGVFNLTSLIELQNIQHLDVTFCDFSDSQIPENMGSFKHLRYLNLSFSWFAATIPYSLGNLPKLEYLDLRNSYGISGEIPSQLGKLISLRYLDLSYNDFRGEIPAQLRNLTHLRYLDLWEIGLSGAIPFRVGNLPFLQTLGLGGNFDLSIKDAKWLSSLSSLDTLRLSSLPLDSSHHWLKSIRELVSNLRELRLVSCSLSDHNISSLFHFHSNLSTSLSFLDLSDNMLPSSTFSLLFNHNSIVFPSPQGNLIFFPKLRELYLANCGLTNESFLVASASTSNFSSSLVTLDISGNPMLSSTIFHWVLNFTPNLHRLNLDYNFIEGLFPNRFGNVMNSLEVLSLFSNKLHGEIPASLGHICTLRDLDLTGNNFSGKLSSFIQNSSRCNKHVFQSLKLSGNRITGMLPNLSSFTSLSFLDLSDNQLYGEIPKSIGLLQELESLYLEGNNLAGDITELHLTNLSKLKVLDLTDNSLSLKFSNSWIPPFQLFKLGLGSCKVGPSFPSWLQTQNRLEFLDISDAEIDDFVPEGFWNKLQYISKLNMSQNSLKGTIPNIPIKLTNHGGAFIFLSLNQLEGEIPAFLSQASMLDLSGNNFSDLSMFFCRKSTTTSMYTLDLSNNQIEGQLPNCWEHLKGSLQFLDLKNNKLSGKIPQSMGTLVNLQYLTLRNNNLTGQLPFTLKSCTKLSVLDVGQNLLSGAIPSWIGENLQQLNILSLRLNNFSGSVPDQICYLRQINLLDLSMNHLSRGIPTCLRNLTTMKERGVVAFRKEKFRRMSSRYFTYEKKETNVLFMWKGQDHEFWNAEYLLKSIDISSNELTGEIPKELGYLVGLVSVNLSRNNLSREIPREIGNLDSLEFLDLSRNHLSGRIPSTLANIDRLTILDLSNNNLRGRIPWGRQLQTFEASSFEGNIGLCGQQLNRSCPGDKTEKQPQGEAVDSENDNSDIHGGLYMSLGLGFFTGFWGLLASILLWRPWRFTYITFLNRLVEYILLMVELNVAKCHRWLEG
ncbi:receptor-like protein EIX2 [Vigna umbellata]|uniref:receptor-like protein EIX2 n=1 Tax=Vigna umbellata TaxID=87088 RepID=UPI001F5E7CF6|nr:receptor-like protein EIX2 [Vigna umbellata]